MLFTPSHIEYNTDNLQEPTYMRTHTDFPLSVLLSRFFCFSLYSLHHVLLTWQPSVFLRLFQHGTFPLEDDLNINILVALFCRFNVFAESHIWLSFQYIFNGVTHKLSDFMRFLGRSLRLIHFSSFPLASIRINLIFWSLFNNKHQWLTYAFEYLHPISTSWNLGQKVTHKVNMLIHKGGFNNIATQMQLHINFIDANLHLFLE